MPTMPHTASSEAKAANARRWAPPPSTGPATPPPEPPARQRQRRRPAHYPAFRVRRPRQRQRHRRDRARVVPLRRTGDRCRERQPAWHRVAGVRRGRYGRVHRVHVCRAAFRFGATPDLRLGGAVGLDRRPANAVDLRECGTNQSRLLGQGCLRLHGISLDQRTTKFERPKQLWRCGDFIGPGIHSALREHDIRAGYYRGMRHLFRKARLIQ